jgi:uncharacterized protein (DUF488 family)
MIYTIGHSTLPQQKFIDTITGLDILIDVRSHPSSKWPQFWKENLEVYVPQANIEYQWWKGLGGWDVEHEKYMGQMLKYDVDITSYLKGKFPKQTIAKVKDKVSDRPMWTNQGLYDYSFFMITEEFLKSANTLMDVGSKKDVGIMCCEVLWWKCHRSLISDYLYWNGIDSTHVQPKRTSHSKAIGNRIERYHPAIIEAWGLWKSRSTVLVPPQQF